MMSDYVPEGGTGGWTLVARGVGGNVDCWDNGGSNECMVLGVR
jgi:hypothetical protein